ncbi:claudin-23-like [Astyanax mexicanus]|uniref:claudin-23-like n=1 Tax=Astyanax mexicanus TaxID=7994 RepID=UPI0020CB4FCF|nr:claudin-23-like [Astyanax mexicanus]
MRTPGIIIFGLVLAPCGWILDLTSTVAPNWRTLTSVSGQPQDTVYNQGIWDMCKSSTTSTTVTCNQVDTLYFNNQIIPIAKGMMVASLIVTLIGLAVVTPGARCWRDRPPRWALTSFGAVLIFCSGALTIIPIAWYTYLMPSLNSTYSSTSTNNVGYCIVLGYIGGILEVLAGIVLFVGVCRCCNGKNRGEKASSAPVRARTTNTTTTNQFRPAPRAYPRANVESVPSSRSSTAPSSRSNDDVNDYPRANYQKSRGVVNPSFKGQPYDADL